MLSLLVKRRGYKVHIYQSNKQEFSLKVLTTLSASPLIQQIVPVLEQNHIVRMVDRADSKRNFEFEQSELGHGPETNKLVSGMDAIIHSGWLDPELSASDQLDYQMRCTYNLLWAAAEEGVSRFIYLSSLKLMEGYDSDLAVTERWKPTPTSDISVIGCHLGEMVCREFARERKINVVVLRLGEITQEGNSSPSTSALYVDDAIQAIEKSITAETSGWLDIFHIQSDVPDARFLTGQPWWSADDVTGPISIGYLPRARG